MMAKQIVFLLPEFSHTTKFVPKAATTAVTALIMAGKHIAYKLTLGITQSDWCVSPFERTISGLLHPLIYLVFPSLAWRDSIDFLLICLRILQYCFWVLHFAALQGNESLPLNLELLLTLLDYSSFLQSQALWQKAKSPYLSSEVTLSL